MIASTAKTTRNVRAPWHNRLYAANLGRRVLIRVGD